ncbi:hypothetical protein EON79_21685 [bacterium]|nr:MAG: hypothetical protein EON79_21685 [bacterium]
MLALLSMPSLPISSPVLSAAPVRVQAFARHDPALDAPLREIAEASGFPDDLAFAAGRIDPKTRTVTYGAFQGEAGFYPASVVKLFYMAKLEDEIAKGKIRLTPELDRAETDMIRESVNDATGLVLETITDTAGGPELAPKALEAWMRKRARVNDWLTTRGFTGVNARQKTWNEGPYGRERQGYGPGMELRNVMTAVSGLQMMTAIDLGLWHPAAQCERMLGLLNRRDPKATGNQVAGFVGEVLPKEWPLWSKAGWTSAVRHDLLVTVTPKGDRLVLAILTKGHAGDERLVGTLGKAILKSLAPDALP